MNIILSLLIVIVFGILLNRFKTKNKITRLLWRYRYLAVIIITLIILSF